jgi:hypothetical protein
MLRALLLILFLAANAALAAVQFGLLKWRDILPTTGREPTRVTQQLEPGRIRLAGAQISGETVAATATPGSAATGAETSTTSSTPNTPNSTTAANKASESDAGPNPNAASSASAVAAAASQALAATGSSAVSSDAATTSAATAAAQAAAASTCLDVGPFAATDAQQARGLLLAAMPSGQGDIQSLAVDKRYWVHLDPVPNKAAADKQIALLRSAGVTEYFVLNGDGSNLVVSLGLMATAQKKGITPQLSERPNAKSRIVYRIAGINANAASQLRGVVTQQWSAQLVKACPAPVGSPPALAH